MCTVVTQYRRFGATLFRSSLRTLPRNLPAPSPSRHPTVPSLSLSSPRRHCHHGQEKVSHYQRPVDLHGHDWLLLQLQASACGATNGHAQIRPHRFVSLIPQQQYLPSCHSNADLSPSSQKGSFPGIEKETQMIALILR